MMVSSLILPVRYTITDIINFIAFQMKLLLLITKHLEVAEMYTPGYKDLIADPASGGPS